ncbi:hypothetical protein BpHYR1_020489 [Brachionus plicatilis]|uniref:CCHC-type domain-containing protein n=1 Tax=Brachionus plicatilis TaxID=10195 RepID=A0A3M7PR70_BRAPC|nr:hypothetical protein BpHYR1_020489 [Brachionus plicatilis]
MNINRMENDQFRGISEYEGSSNNRSESAHKKCYSCQRYGHLAKYCDFKTRKQSLSSRILTVLDNNEQTPRQTTATYVKIKINGKNITAALDSGAAKTMISSSFGAIN